MRRSASLQLRFLALSFPRQVILIWQIRIRVGPNCRKSIKNVIMNPPSQRQKNGQSPFKVILLVTAFFFGGMAQSALYFYNIPQSNAFSDANLDAALSGGTKKVLQRLNSPVEIHYYSVLD